MVQQGGDGILAGYGEARADERHLAEPQAFEKKSGSSSGSINVTDVDPDYPTDEDFATLRQVPAKIPWTAWTVAFIELCERFSYYGCTAVYVNFIQQGLPDGSDTGAGGTCPTCQSGALGMGQRASTGLVTFNSFWNYVTPLIGGYLADTYFGRYYTICGGTGITLIGHTLLIFTAIPSMITQPNSSIALFAVAMVVIGIGTGGFKPNVSVLIAEQVHTQHPTVKTLKSGERVIVDPALTATRLYNYFYLLVNIGALAGQLGMVYAEANVGFWLSFSLPTFIFLLCPIVLATCARFYRRTPPSGSVLGPAFKTLNLALRGRRFSPKQWNSPDFWERVKPSHIPEGERPKWMTFDDQFVDELRRAFKACKVFLFFPFFWITYNQILGNLTSQAATMDTGNTPNDVIQNIDPIALIIFIPFCDLVMYPGLRKLGFNFTPLKRIAMGFFLGSLAMISAAVQQHYIYKLSPCGYSAGECDDFAPISVWWQVITYVLIAFSEIFASITGLEYAFTKAPASMRSMVMAIFLFMTAIGTAINQAFVSLSADPLLVWNYGSMAVIAFIAGAAFSICFYKLDQHENELNALQAGHINADKRKAYSGKE